MKFLSTLQNLPLQTRVRIMWGTTGAIVIILIIILAQSISSRIKHVDTSDLNIRGEQIETVAGSKHAAVEWIEKENGKLLVYFKITNDTSDLLNVSTAANVSLTALEQEFKAESLTDRQNKDFPFKILSKTQQFGLAIFPEPPIDLVSIKFGNMYFESDNPAYFAEEFPLNLKELNKPLKIGQ